METSAKNATNVEQAFMAMAAEIKNRYSNNSFLVHDLEKINLNSATLFLIFLYLPAKRSTHFSHFLDNYYK